jgi:hypothetical protein
MRQRVALTATTPLLYVATSSRCQMETSTWNRPNMELYEYFQTKRVLFARQEIENIKALLGK